MSVSDGEFTASTTFTIIVLDVNRPPTITVPNDITVPATSPEGALVDYVVMAMDPDDGPLTASCDHPSGTTFPLGMTTVTCTATDAGGLTASDSFLVTVQLAAETFEGLVDELDDSDLHGGVFNPLRAKIEDALSMFEDGDLEGAIQELQKAVDHADRNEGHKLTTEEAGEIRGLLQTLIDWLLGMLD